MIHPHTEIRFINDKIGYGVVATKFIPKGTITWALDKFDRIFAADQIKNMEPVYQNIMDIYSYRNPEGKYILCWDNARFVNHSSNSNCITTAYEFEIAVRDIHPGEELTDDYGYLNVEEPFEVVPEEGTDRHVIYPDDLLRHYYTWDEKLLQAFGDLLDVNQPLWSLLSEQTKNKAQLIAKGNEKMDSILNCYCPEHGKINGEAKLIKERSSKVVYPF
jgi:hypothetical protein